MSGEQRAIQVGDSFSVRRDRRHAMTVQVERIEQTGSVTRVFGKVTWATIIATTYTCPITWIEWNGQGWLVDADKQLARSSDH
jgi:hypothetical protein